MLRYAITDSKSFGGDLSARRRGLLAQAKRLGDAGIDYLQLREKDLHAAAVLMLAEELASALKSYSDTKLLISARADVAVAANADGVHLTSHPEELTPDQVCKVFAIAGSLPPIVSVSCHTLEDVQRARDHRADILLFGPVFEKRVRGELVTEGLGLDALRLACQAAGNIPVLALGGMSSENLSSCIECGAAGVAGIRLFP